MRAENIAKLGKGDIIVANYPGSGNSWFSSLCLHLGIFYVSGYDELLVDQFSKHTIIVDDVRRQHVDILQQREILCACYDESLRLINTHENPQAFVLGKQKAVLIVRDGRDAVLSYYYWKRNFAGLEISLTDYLRGTPATPPPAYGWAYFNANWLNAIPNEQCHLFFFERGKQQPREEIQRLLAFLGISRTAAQIDVAIEQSSYSTMQEREKASLKQLGLDQRVARVMRQGKIDAWREELTPEMLATFSGFPAKILKSFGYSAVT